MNKQSEDCLFLNVFAPTSATEHSKLPVYVFISGGGFIRVSDANYNGSGLIEAADHSMVVVNFNYRVGPFGFLTDGGMLSANNGLWDQVKVLEWVQKHISKFGGDPKHVVIGGDSAGGASVAYHLARDHGTNHGLFVSAAGQEVSASALFTLSESQYLYESFAIRAGCTVSDSAASLRAAFSEALQAANINVQPLPGSQSPPLYGWGPVIDGEFISEPTYAMFRNG
jgi:cholinesterase